MHLRGLRGRPARPKPDTSTSQKVGLEDRLEHHLPRPLDHPVPDRRDAQRPAAALRLGDLHPPDRQRAIATPRSSRLKLAEQALDAVLLDRSQRHRSTPAAPVASHPPPRLPQDVTPPDPVIQGVKAATRRPLGGQPIACAAVLARPRQWPPTAPFRWPQQRANARRGRWIGRSRPCPNAYLRRNARPKQGPFAPGAFASRRSPLLRPPRTPAALRPTSPSAYTNGLR